jgi:hypothetical protein
MEVITISGATDDPTPFTPFRIASSQAVLAIMATNREAREAGPKHYKAPIFAEYKFRSIGFHTEGQYYVRYAEHICF